MSIFKIHNFNGLVKCKSTRGMFVATCNNFSYEFNPGVYVLQGEIDSGAWAYCYSLCKVYNQRKSDVLLDEETELYYMNDKVSLSFMKTKTCYLDNIKQHFYDEISRKTVKQVVEKNLMINNNKKTAEEIRDIFDITSERYNRNLKCVGNEIFICKAAIGYSNDKMIYIFPWLSKKLTQYYMGHIEHVVDTLCKLNKIVLLPTSFDFSLIQKYNVIRMDT